MNASPSIPGLLSRLQWPLYLAVTIALSGCAGAPGGSPAYDALRCDRNGEESQRRAC
jgi:hypothetical protein